MTDRIAEIRARLDNATPGPWRTHGRDGDHVVSLADEYVVTSAWTPADSALIAHAPDDLAWLLAENELLRAALADEMRVSMEQEAG